MTDLSSVETAAPAAPVAAADVTPAWMEHSIGRLDQRLLSVLLTLGSMLLAWVFRWTQDDAFISLRYAQQLADGNGLVYNAGEYVEGYSNFVWTVLMAVPIRLGWDPVEFGHVVGVLCLGVTVLLTLRVARAALGSQLLANAAVVALMATVTFIAYGTGGLETSLQTAMVMAVVVLLLPTWTSGELPTAARAVGVSLLCAAALMTRMDSAVVLLVPVGVVALRTLRRRAADGGVPRSLGVLAALVLPALVVLGSWTLWRHSVYGQWLPNTATAKRSDPLSLVRGVLYFAMFGLLTGTAAFVPILCTAGRSLARVRPFGVLLATIGVWSLYVLAVGADFMEFRFMVVVLPLVAVVKVALLLRIRSTRWQLAVVAALACSIPLHTMVFRGAANVDSVGLLHETVGPGDESWRTLGRLLGEQLGSNPGSNDVVIGVTPAGAIPFESHLTTIDMLGLTDPWTARHGVELPYEVLPKAGHEHLATIAHLRDRDVSLLIGHPRFAAPAEPGEVYGAGAVDALFLHEAPDPEHIPDDASMVEVPVDDERVLMVLYLEPDDDVERLLAEGTWREVELDMDQP